MVLQFKHVFTSDRPGSIADYYNVDKNVIGEGSFGKVSKGSDKTTGVTRAIKAIAFQAKGKKLQEEMKRLEDEVAVQQALDHPNIVKLYEVFKDARCIYLVMEMCTGGELFDRIINEVEAAADAGREGAFDENKAATYMTQIMGAMSYLHGLYFAHRDINPENFLMQNEKPEAPIKVIDFGLAKRCAPGAKMTTRAGTPFYVAPEILSGPYDHRCDIWSCGVILYILLCGYPPFHGNGDSEIMSKVKKGKYEFASPEWDDVSKGAKD